MIRLKKIPRVYIKEREKKYGTESNSNNHNGKWRRDKSRALSGDRTKHSKQFYQPYQS